MSRSQLLELGLSDRAIKHRLRRGFLYILYRSVYVVGRPDVSPQGRLLGATMGAGPGAVASHGSAAWLWGLRRGSMPAVEVTAPRQRRRPEFLVHHATIPPDELTTLRNIPVTTVPRTILDNAAVLKRPRLERLIDEAEILRLTDPLSLHDMLERHRGRRGLAALRQIVAEGLLGATITRSELEERFLAFLDAHGLPRPQTNVLIELRPGWTIEADCVWPEQRVIVELDGHATHATTRSFERDRERDRALAVLGWIPVRVTWRQLHRGPGALAADLDALLGRTLARASA